MRDTTAWLKHQPDALRPVRYAYGYGSSQSGRFLRDFLYEGFNTDEHDRQVFDGVMAHIAGASRIDLKRRWATPSGLGDYDATSFPFADARAERPGERRNDGDARQRALRGHAPKMFYTNTPVEYWGGGRVAALVHTSPDGTADLDLPENVRVYFFAGTQHSPGRFPPAARHRSADRQPDRLLVDDARAAAGDGRVGEDGVAPPPSRLSAAAGRNAREGGRRRVPGDARRRIAADAAAAARASPIHSLDGRRGAGAPLPLLVPQVDEDGNERAGIRLPESRCRSRPTPAGISVSRRSARRANWCRCSDRRSRFRATRAAREAAKDPRRSIEERYRSRRLPRAGREGGRCAGEGGIF